ncbi:MAG: DUF1566 domain-containing protein [Bradymonadales bacterium]|nr:DUF1566 domain-containing protein [Bradymonadales bacterium]
MLRRTSHLLFVSTLAAGLLLPFGAQASLSGSSVVFDSDSGGNACWQSEQSQTFCFWAESVTQDTEYVYTLWLEFPVDWTITGVTDVGPTFCTYGGYFYSFGWTYHDDDTYEAKINQTRLQYDRCYTAYCVEVSTGTSGADQSAMVSWYWSGNGNGNPPHYPASDDGYTPAGQSGPDELLESEAEIPRCDPLDSDADGWTVSDGDCDDTNTAINPGAVEICDGLDNDCDGATDAVEGWGFAGETGVIVDNDTVSFEVEVHSVGTINDVNVHLDILHTYRADLAVSLTSPEETTVSLFSAVGGVGDDFPNITLDDEALVPIKQDSTYDYTGGVFVPQGALADFDGESADGTWTLTVEDRLPGDVGELRNLVLAFNTDTLLGGSWWFADGDSDESGSTQDALLACEAPSGYVDNSGDCDDGNPEVHPGHPDVDDLFDNDCDGLYDEDGLACGDVVITEVMVQPSGSATMEQGQWIEVANLTDLTDSPRPLNLRGWWLELPRAGISPVRIDADLIVQPGQHVVLGASSDTDVNGGVEVDWVWPPSIVLTDPLQGIWFDIQQSGIYWPNPGPIGDPNPGDQVFVFYDPITTASGRSLQLDPRTYGHFDNNQPSNWCDTLTIWEPLSGGDFGSPGQLNPICCEDLDEDGWDAAWCNGSDCDDGDPDVNPNQEEDPVNHIDDDCDEVVDECETYWTYQGQMGGTIPDDAYDGTLESMTCLDLVIPERGDGHDLISEIPELVVELEHNCSADLVIKLVSPQGTVLTVLNRPLCEESADDGTGPPGGTPILCGCIQNEWLYFSDAYETSAENMGEGCVWDPNPYYCDPVASCSGCCYHPSPGTGEGTSFADFVGEPAYGRWKLCVGDALPGDEGEVDSVLLSIRQTTTGGLSHYSYPDLDGDGYGDQVLETYQCISPPDFITTGGDCDDSDEDVNPDAAEVCDGIDNDCDGFTDDADDDVDPFGFSTWYVDVDEDGFGNPNVSQDACVAPDGYVADATDCDDTVASVNHDATEICNEGVDDDCDGFTDDGDPSVDPATKFTWYADDDEDGYGDADAPVSACIQPAGTVTNDNDCDDGNDEVYPGAVEVCDGEDNDCDPATDENTDGDTDGSSICDGDCDDGDDEVYPDAAEVCDGKDNDCDPTTDENIDGDGDGLSTCDGDCDDGDDEVYPGAAEVCDGKDNDCDPATDENVDGDGDGWTLCEGDCDDGGDEVYPGAPELCDGKDNDCNPATDENTDKDEDGWSLCEGDCDDDNAEVYPGAPELCDGLDNNCSGSVPAFETDHDEDGWSLCEGDCDDGNAEVYPGAPELCDGLDNNCSGSVPIFEIDHDEDGQLECQGDCDPFDATVFLGAPELCDGLDNDCNGEIDDGAGDDLDGDGYHDCVDDCDDTNSDSYVGSPEICDGEDNDCDGVIAADEADEDDDGWMICEGDCNDGDGQVHPEAEEVCDDGKDNDCDGDTDGDDSDCDGSDSGADTDDESTGCGCRTSAPTQPRAISILFGLLAVTALWRRRTRRGAPRNLSSARRNNLYSTIALLLLLSALAWGCGDDEIVLDADAGPSADVDSPDVDSADVDADGGSDADIGTDAEDEIEPCPAEVCDESTWCQEAVCGETTYHCTNIEDSWEWRVPMDCDDGDPCTFDDSCIEGACEGVPITCMSTDCILRTCNGTELCSERLLPDEATCGSTSCPRDTCAAGTHYDYPPSCARYCDGAGSCETCSCTALATTCAVGGSNQCCIATCDSLDGCATEEAGSCEDLCGTTSLTIGRSCTGCGDNLADGTCGGGDTYPCDVSHSCESHPCGGTTYYCTDFGGSWEWQSSAACGSTSCEDDYCDDNVFHDYPESCTRNCDGAGTCDTCSCTALPTICAVGESNQCCLATCDADGGCATEAGSCEDLCDTTSLTIGRSCSGCGENLADSTCLGGDSYPCNADHLCESHSCNDTTYTCTNVGDVWEWRTSTDCDDGDACSENEFCSDGLCQGSQLDCGDWMTCVAGDCVDCVSDQYCGADCVDCADLGQLCNDLWGVCVADSCMGQDDFTPCEVITSPDRSYDICLNEVCTSPGCGDESCNVPGPHFVNPDTNQRHCYDEQWEITCPAPGQDFYGQDAQYGWDTVHQSDERFIRERLVTDQSVVIDNLTGLTWQGCPFGLTGADCTGGHLLNANWSDQLANCDELDWGGYTDWRLPDPYELMTLLDQGKAASPFLDTSVFPGITSRFFWSSSSVAGDTDHAWFANFNIGGVTPYGKALSLSARCVRSGPLQPRRFEPSIIEGERVVQDTLTGLTWQGCAAGLTGEDCGSGSATTSDWQTALLSCEELIWGGRDDWRLPDAQELHGIVDYRYTNPSIGTDAFPATPSGRFWSSTTSRTTIDQYIYARRVSFVDGSLEYQAKATANHVRCVRGGLSVGGLCSQDGDCRSEVCHDTWGICAVPSCVGEDDFTPCELVTTPDRSYDICLNQVCVSPGCGDASCNAPGPHFSTPDTNQRQCYDDDSELTTCPQAGEPFSGQDAHYGWDTENDANQRFSRDLSIAEQPVVVDDITGLMWQGCARGQTGDSCSGSATAGNWEDALSYCDGLSWGEQEDWRLPDEYELQSLVDYGRQTAPFVGTSFPATPSDLFWSSSFRAADTGQAWGLHFDTGALDADVPKTSDAHVRCVRGRTTNRPARFDRDTSIEDEPTVSDDITGLMWQGCAAGLTGEACTGSATISSWSEALAYCENLEWAGGDDWRLPNLAELRSIVDNHQSEPAIDATVFQNTPASHFWSSSSRAALPDHAWCVDFQAGALITDTAKTTEAHIRCVRGGRVGDRCTRDHDCFSGRCSDSWGICVVSDCTDQDDFTPCEVITTRDRSYDICVNEVCRSPGCETAACNTPGPHFPIPDTNQRQCYDDDALTPCPDPGQDFCGQDAQHGWDLTYESGERFSRNLSVNENPVVTDHVTGLVWQGCAYGLSGADCTRGAAIQADWYTQLAHCDNLDWGGHRDWRLPDAHELVTLVDYGQTSSILIDTAAFPSTPISPTAWYSSSTSIVESSSAKKIVSFTSGELKNGGNMVDYFARCVRGTPVPQPARFTRDTSSAEYPVVVDTWTSLMWQGCPLGQTGDACSGSVTASNWQDALSYCDDTTWGGYSDWRLPNAIELQSIANFIYPEPNLDAEAFSGTWNGDYCWTSTTMPQNPTQALRLRSDVLRGDKDAMNCVRCVRSGEWD